MALIFSTQMTANVTLSNNNYIYDGKEKKPDVTVKYGYATLQQGTDYTVEYSNNVKAGTAMQVKY